jgi:hypothetical protein
VAGSGDEGDKALDDLKVLSDKARDQVGGFTAARRAVKNPRDVLVVQIGEDLLELSSLDDRDESIGQVAGVGQPLAAALKERAQHVDLQWWDARRNARAHHLPCNMHN